MNYFISGFAAGAVLVPGSWLAAISFGVLSVAEHLQRKKS